MIGRMVNVAHSEPYNYHPSAILLEFNIMTKRRKIAPLLRNGDPRVRLYGRLPDAVKEGLRRIAKSERKSMSWVIEEVIIDYFELPIPKYKNGRS